MQIQHDEIYNLIAQSHVAVSFESPEYTADVDLRRICRGLPHRLFDDCPVQGAGVA